MVAGRRVGIVTPPIYTREETRPEQIDRYEAHGYPLGLVRALDTYPQTTLDHALDWYAVEGRKVA